MSFSFSLGRGNICGLFHNALLLASASSSIQTACSECGCLRRFNYPFLFFASQCPLNPKIRIAQESVTN
uniref:Putative secreted protein n=1 Tax=Anopheles darlingi TaxID=43151 RepID=A0A2M4D1C4_ANODA